MHPAPGIEEDGVPGTGLAGAGPLHLPPALMDQAVMEAAEEEAVVEARGPAIGPVADMMAIGEAASAAGEAAPPIPGVQGAAERGRDGSGPTPHVQDPTVRIMHHPDEPRIAAEAPGTFS
jgi:hypothetical protein